MGLRRQARELALQMLYQLEMLENKQKEIPPELWESTQKGGPQVKGYTEMLVQGVLSQKEEIDQQISRHATHWKLTRMALVDRNVLRIAVYELMQCLDIPLKVILNEAIEIAKKFGAEESSVFINGILDKIAKELRRE